MERALLGGRIEALPVDLDLLLTESAAELFRGLQRLRDDWLNGVIRFNLPGEALFEARWDSSLVGVCGLNQDPYRDDAVGRLRHLYVAR